MKEQLVHALKTKYDADYQMHKANLDIYLNNPVGIGEHPQHFEEMDKLVEWHEVEIVRNIRVYDSALTLQDFVE